MKKKAVRFSFRTLLRVAMMSLLLAGCAAQRAHREGLQNMDMGQWEQGLAKLDEATQKDPQNPVYRADYLTHRDHAINRLLAAADGARAAAKRDEAEALYRRVLGLDRENARALAGLRDTERNQRHAAILEEARELMKKEDAEGTQAKLRAIFSENPNHAEARALVRAIDEKLVKDAMSAPRLATRHKKPVTLQFRDANIKMVFEALSRTSGVNFILDKDVRGDVKTTIFVQQVSVDDAIDLILSQNQLAKKVLSENTVFVYPNNPAKQKEYQDQIIKSFYLTNADAKQAMNLLKTMLNTKVIFIDEKSNMLVMRESPEAVRMAEKLLASLDLPDPEVMMEVEVLEIKRSKLTELGIKYPGQWTLSASGATSGTLTLKDLQDLNSSRILSGPVNLTVDLKKEAGETNVLASPRIRARNREKAKILIGDRVPVITNTVTPTTTGASVVTGNVQYVDVGLKLEVEPSIHLDNDVAIKVNLEVSTIVKEINTASGTLAYQIGTRTASTLLRLRDGETQILAGLISDEERKSATKIPGLGDIPILGRLFSSHKNDDQKTEIVLSITPRLVRNLDRPDARITEFWFGTESAMRSAPLSVESVAAAKTAAPAPASTAVHLPPETTAGLPPATGPAPARAVDDGETAVRAAAPAISWQGPAEAKVGEQFEVMLNLNNGDDFSKLALQMSYDPSALELVAVDEGDLGMQSGQAMSFRQESDAATGKIRIEVAPPAGATLHGEGAIAVVTFKAIAATAKAPVSLQLAALTDKAGKNLPATLPAPYAFVLNP